MLKLMVKAAMRTRIIRTFMFVISLALLKAEVNHKPRPVTLLTDRGTALNHVFGGLAPSPAAVRAFHLAKTRDPNGASCNSTRLADAQRAQIALVGQYSRLFGGVAALYLANVWPMLLMQSGCTGGGCDVTLESQLCGGYPPDSYCYIYYCALAVRSCHYCRGGTYLDPSCVGCNSMRLCYNELCDCGI